MTRRPPKARTAFGPMFVTAIEQYTPPEHRIVDDPLAARMLPATMRFLARAGRWRPLREWLEAASDRKALGVWGGVLCRKRYARDRVGQALAGGIGQLVILGAGLDTIAYGWEVPVFEVDLPENIDYKRDRLRAIFGDVPDGVRLVPVNFDHFTLEESLTAQGFRADLPTMFVWEAVTQYLTAGGFRGTLSCLAKAAPGSRLVFTFVRREFLEGKEFYGAKSLYRDFVAPRRVWHVGLEPSEVDGLLREYGWAEREQAGPAEYAERYLKPAGRDLPASEIERFVRAERT
ncbi:SAM-dependent methyltransferase [Amycolatopsis sp. GM8]|uniref:SAM-dependent methyltransferase n=1 Tax=Amycolatopsis sp. GM8 TaxID=2896530 RepID=UPI001F024774|nr:SAM-dependent methyltransferase [Amycolatopsis sp. GM8]